jgi:hypothetical protein
MTTPPVSLTPERASTSALAAAVIVALASGCDGPCWNTRTTPAHLTAWLEQSNGQPAAGKPIAVEDDVFPAPMGDLNGDGRTDLLSRDTAGQLCAQLSKGDGSFAAPACTGARDVRPLVAWRTADFNRDGTLDLAQVYFFSVTVSMGKGDGTFAASVEVPVLHDLNRSDGQLEMIGSGDFDGDGATDLVVAGPAAGAEATSSTEALYVVHGEGDGSFRPPVANPTTWSRLGPLAVGDFDEDGRADVVALSSTSAPAETNAVVLWRGQRDRALSAPGWSQVAERRDSSTIAVADFNGDGHLDAGGPRRRSISWLSGRQRRRDLRARATDCCSPVHRSLGG